MFITVSFADFLCSGCGNKNEVVSQDQLGVLTLNCLVPTRSLTVVAGGPRSLLRSMMSMSY